MCGRRSVDAIVSASVTKKRSDQITPLMRRPRRKTQDAQLPITTCPHCGREDVQVMPSGLLALHAAPQRWKRGMCRGGGDPVAPGKPRRR
jgi:hypothetical protein